MSEKPMLGRLKLLAFSMLLSLSTGFLVNLAREETTSARLLWVCDVLSLPGGFFAGIAFPQGIHSGGPWVMGWVVLAMLGNMVFYTLVWALVLRRLGRVKALKRSKA